MGERSPRQPRYARQYQVKPRRTARVWQQPTPLATSPEWPDVIDENMEQPAEAEYNQQELTDPYQAAMEAYKSQMQSPLRDYYQTPTPTPVYRARLQPANLQPQPNAYPAYQEQLYSTEGDYDPQPASDDYKRRMTAVSPKRCVKIQPPQVYDAYGERRQSPQPGRGPQIQNDEYQAVPDGYKVQLKPRHPQRGQNAQPERYNIYRGGLQYPDPRYNVQSPAQARGPRRYLLPKYSAPASDGTYKSRIPVRSMTPKYSQDGGGSGY